MGSINRSAGCSTKSDRQLRIEFPTPIDPNSLPLYFSYFISTVILIQTDHNYLASFFPLSEVSSDIFAAANVRWEMNCINFDKLIVDTLTSISDSKGIILNRE
jgi:hypothetical protein